MSTLAHILSASFIAYYLSSPTRQPNIDFGLLTTALVVPAVLDLDHLYFVVKNPMLMKTKGQLHLARSPLHELFGVALVGIISLIVSMASVVYAKVIFISFVIHVMEDMIMGKSFPLAPFDKAMMYLFDVPLRRKVVIDVFTICLFGVLWILYLLGIVT